jgi:hypothetical protein
MEAKTAQKEPKSGGTRAKGARQNKPRVTTAIVLRPYTLTIYQRVAALRSAQGTTEESEAGVIRPYSVSALIREALEAQLPGLVAELTKAGIKVSEEPSQAEVKAGR